MFQRFIRGHTVNKITNPSALDQIAAARESGYGAMRAMAKTEAGAQLTTMEVLSAYKVAEPSEPYGTVEWIMRCVERPALVMLGSHSSGEVFAVMEMPQGRILDCDEFSAEDTERATGQSIYEVQP